MPLSPEEWGDFLKDDQQQQAKSSLLGDLMSPDVAAKTLQNSAQRGIPFALNTAEPEDFNKESMISRAQEVANDDPIVQRYLANNDFAPHVSHDDLENLSIYGKSLKAITSGWAGGRALSKFGAASSLPIAMRETELPPEAEQFWKENEEAKKNIPEGGFYHTLAGFSQFLGQVIEGTQEISRKYPVKTPETVGDVLRTAADFPGRALSMIPAAIMTPMNLARDTGNEIYVRHQKEAAAAGLPFDADATAAAATIGGLATIAMLKVGPVPEAEGFIKELAAGALANPTVKRGLGYYMRETTKSGAIFGAAGLGQTLIQTFAEDIAREASSPEFKTIMNDPAKRAELRDNMIEAAAGGFVLGAAMHIPHVGVSYLNDRRLIAEARADQQNYKAASLSAARTETYNRSPEAFKTFTDTAAAGKEIGIPADAIVQAFGDKALEKFGFVQDFEAKLAAANERGGDVKIPLKDWLVALKDDPALGPALEEDLRIRPEGLTMREADALKEAKPEDYNEPQAKVVEQTTSDKAKEGRTADQQGAERSFIDTRGRGIQFHGSSNPELKPDSGHYSTLNYYGQGFYATDAVDIAHGYSKRRGFGALPLAKDETTRNLYQVKEKHPLKILDGEAPLSKELIDTLTPEDDSAGVIDSIMHDALAENPKNLRELYDAVRERGTDEGYSADTIQEVFDGINSHLQDLGYNGLSHIGGLKTKKPAHKVTIYFDPEKDIEISKVDFENHMVPPPPPATVEEAVFTEAGKAAKKELWLNPLFKDGASAGMTEQEFARYSKKLQAEDTDARDKAVKQAAKAIGKRETAEWKENQRRVRDEVSTELSYRPDLMADTFFRTGKYPGVERMKGFKLDSDLIRERYGEDTLNSLDPSTVSKSGGIDPDDAAGLFGFRSGDGLVNGLAKVRRDRGEVKPGEFLKSLIDQEAAERMEHQYGVLAENIMEKAREDVGTGGQADLLADEAHYLQTLLTHKEGDETQPARQITAELIAERAKEATKTALAKDVANIGEITRDVGRAGRQAELALLKDNIAEAFKAKFRQAISFALLRVAKAFKREYEATQTRIERFSKNAVVAGVDQGYTDQIHNLLNMVGENIPRTEENLTRALDGEKIDDFINKKGEDGRIIPPLNLPPRKALGEFTAEEYKDFAQTLQSLEANGRAEKQIEIAGKIFDFETAVAQGLENLDSMKGSFDPRKMKGFRSIGRNFDAAMIKMEQLFDWIDKNDPTGVFNRLVFRPFSEAEHWKLDKLRELSADFKGLPKGFRRMLDLRRAVENETLINPEDGLPMKLNRGNMLAIALNWGSESNRAKLLGGFGWEEGEVEGFLNQHMKKEDWEYVQKVWDVFDKLKPEVERVTRKLSGVAVDLVEPKEIQNQHGTFKGGYYPLIEDEYARINREKVTDLFGGGMFQMLPTTQAVKRRTGKMYPLSLELDAAPGVLVDTVHYLAFVEPMLNAKKFLGDRLIRSGISEGFGPEYTKQLNPWLEYIGKNGGAADQRHLAWYWKVLREGRMNAQAMLIGFNPITPLLHGGSALANSFQEVGLAHVGAFTKALPGAPKDWLESKVTTFFRSPQNMQNMTEFVMEKSGEIRNRKLKIDENMQAMWQGSVGKSTLRTSFHQMGMSMVGLLDQWSAIPTWKAIYDGALKRGIEEADAIYMADKAVRNAHGASGITDTPAVQRGPEPWKWATMFMTYFVHNYNRLRDTARIAEGKTELEGWGKWGTVAGRSLMYLAVPALLHEALRGHGKKDESWGEWVGNALASQAGGGLPLVRDMIYAGQNGRGVSGVMQDAMDGLVAPVKDAMNVIGGHKVSDKWVKHTLEFPGWSVGLSTKEIARVGQYLWDVNKGKQPAPQGFKEWWNGVTQGKTRPK